MIPLYPISDIREDFCECPECHSKKIAYDSGETFCKRCGLVLDDTVFATYNVIRDTFRHNEMKKTCSVFASGLGSTIGKHMNGSWRLGDGGQI